MELQTYKNKRICVAISGGVDSVALLHFLKTQEGACGFTLSALHCEHGIRGEESLEDMRFVERYCRDLGVELTVFQEDCPQLAKQEKISLETAARKFRLRCFESLISSKKADFIATAHHLGDEAETVLFRLARGSSLSGAKGMTERDGYLIRPLLSWTKLEIESYVKENGLSYRVDSTNLDNEYTRNKLRHEVLPKLEEAVDGASGNLARFATLAGEDDELLYAFAKELLVETDEGYLVKFSDKKPLFRRASLLALKGLGLEKDYTALHLEQAFALQSLERGAKCTLPKDILAIKTADGVAFCKATKKERAEKAKTQPFTTAGFDGGEYVVSVSSAPIEETGRWRVLKMDAGKLPQDAVFRFREEGDYMERFGGGKKSLKKFFNEKKIDVAERAYLPLIAVGDEIYAVCGVEISEKLRVGESSEKILYLALAKK